MRFCLLLLVHGFERGTHFHLIARESGSVRSDLPVWRPAAEVLRWDPARDVFREEVGVPGAFVLQNVLSSSEADQLTALSEAMGYTQPPQPTTFWHV